MKVTVALPAYVGTYAEGEARVTLELAGGTISDVLVALFARHPGVRDRIVDELGVVRMHVNIFVGAESIRFTGGLQTPVNAGDCITVLPAVSGGA